MSSARTPWCSKLINRVSVEAAFFRKLSPMENLLYSARLYGVPAGQARGDIRAILTRLGIKPDRISQPLESMSRGMQQKVAIARAFLTAPVLLLLDEPTTGLDPRSKLDVQRFVARATRHARRDDPADDARHGRGRRALRPHRDHRRRAHRGRWRAGRAEGGRGRASWGWIIPRR